MVGLLPVLALTCTVCIQVFLCALTILYAQIGATSIADSIADGHQLPAATSLPIPKAWQSRTIIATDAASRTTVHVAVPSVIGLSMPHELSVTVSIPGDVSPRSQETQQ